MFGRESRNQMRAFGTRRFTKEIMRTTSDNFTKLMIGFEGEVLKGYLDSAGFLSVGIGHLCKKDESYRLGKAISLDESRRLFRQDSAWAIKAVDRMVTVELTPNQFDALVSLCFNIGENAFRKSTLLKKLNAANYKGCADAFRQWIYAGGKVSKGLVNRRTKEKVLFEKA